MSTRTYYFIFLGIVLFLAALFRFSLPPVPFTGPDSIGYLGPALRWLESQSFKAIAGRSSIYPAFLTLILITFQSINHIAIIQHLLGLFAGLLFVVSWNRLYRIFLNDEGSFWRKGIYYAFGIFAVTLFLFCGWSISIEQWTHPESVSAFLFMLNFYFLTKLVGILRMEARNIENRVLGLSLLFNLFFVLNVVMFIFQPRWRLSSIMALAIHFVFVALLPVERVKKIVFLAIMPFLLSCFVIVPNGSYTKYDFASETMGLTTIFASNLNSISIEIEKDINNPAFKKYDKRLLRRIIEQYRFAQDRALAKSYGYQWYPTLGYNMDYFLYGPREEILVQYFGKKAQEHNRFYRYYLIRSVLRHPVIFSSKILKELAVFYLGYKKYPLWGLDISSYWQYTEETLKGFSRYFTTKIFLDYCKDVRYAKVLKSDLSLYPTDHVNIVLSFYSWIYSFVVILFLVSLVSMYFLRQWNYFYFGLSGLFLYLTVFTILVVVAIGHSVYYERYVNELLILNLFSESFGIFYLICCLGKIWGDEKAARVLRFYLTPRLHLQRVYPTPRAPFSNWGSNPFWPHVALQTRWRPLGEGHSSGGSMKAVLGRLEI